MGHFVCLVGSAAGRQLPGATAGGLEPGGRERQEWAQREKGVRPSLLTASTVWKAGTSLALTPVSRGVFARHPLFSFSLELLVISVWGLVPVLCCCGFCAESWRLSQVHRREGQLDTTYS